MITKLRYLYLERIEPSTFNTHLSTLTRSSVIETTRLLRPNVILYSLSKSKIKKIKIKTKNKIKWKNRKEKSKEKKINKTKSIIHNSNKARCLLEIQQCLY